MNISTDFPSASGVHNLDSAATGLLPKSVIDTVNEYHKDSCLNAGRSAYLSSIEITDRIESSREDIAHYLGTKPDNLAFTPGATHSISWVASGLKLCSDDTVLITKADHHANILPWLRLRNHLGVKIRWVECDKQGYIDVDDFKNKVRGCSIASFSGASNVTGAIQPLKELVSIARDEDSLTLIDAAQLAPHANIDFDEIDCDFMACSGHKMLSPKGVGVLLASGKVHNTIDPIVVGGGSIADVRLDGYEMKPFPVGFESGTQSIEGILGLAKAVQWYNRNDHSKVFEHETSLANEIHVYLSSKDIDVYHPSYATPTISFSSRKMKPHMIASKLDRDFNVCVRSGHMCALPFTRMVCGSNTGFVRVSVGPWNTSEDVKAFKVGIDSILKP